MAPQKVPVLSGRCWHSQTVVIQNCGSAFSPQVGLRSDHSGPSCPVWTLSRGQTRRHKVFLSRIRAVKVLILLLTWARLCRLVRRYLCRNKSPLPSADLARRFICLCCFTLLETIFLSLSSHLLLLWSGFSNTPDEVTGLYMLFSVLVLGCKIRWLVWTSKPRTGWT